MKKAIYKGKDRNTLVKELVEKKSALRTWHFGEAGTKKRSTHEGARTRKDIARILTELNAK